MDDSTGSESWDQVFSLDNLLCRSMTRLRSVAASEKLMGYAESAKTYADMTNEIQALRQWISAELREKLFPREK